MLERVKLLFEISNKSITFEVLKYSELLRLLKQDGWFVIRQTGSHHIMKHEIKIGTLSIPFHASKEIGKGLLRAILKKAQIVTSER